MHSDMLFRFGTIQCTQFRLTMLVLLVACTCGYASASTPSAADAPCPRLPDPSLGFDVRAYAHRHRDLLPDGFQQRLSMLNAAYNTVSVQTLRLRLPCVRIYLHVGLQCWMRFPFSAEYHSELRHGLPFLPFSVLQPTDPTFLQAIATVDGHFAQAMEAEGAPGMVAQIVVGGKVVWFKGYGQ